MAVVSFMQLKVNMLVSVMEANKGFASVAPKYVMPTIEVRRSSIPNITNARQNTDHLLNPVASGFCSAYDNGGVSFTVFNVDG